MGKRRAHGEGGVYQRADGYWVGSLHIGYDANGKRKRRVVYARTQAKVLGKLSDLRRQASAGIDLSHRQDVGVYLAQWLEGKGATIKPRTLELYQGFHQKADEHIGHVELSKLTALQVQAAIRAIAATSGTATANKVRRMLYGAFKRAVVWRLIPFNPVDGVEPLKESPRRVDLWTPQQAAVFLDTARPHRLYALFYLILSTGLRQGEALALRWSDLKDDHLLVRRTITRVGGRVEFTTPKTSRGERIVTLSPDTVDVLEAHRQRQEAEHSQAADLYNAQGLVFCNEIGGIITPMALHHVWKRLQVKAGVPNVRLHDLRHMHVSLLVQRGLDPRTIADRIGHSDASFTLRRYAHVFEARRRHAAICLSDLLGSKGPIN
jgi:integrase